MDRIGNARLTGMWWNPLHRSVNSVGSLELLLLSEDDGVVSEEEEIVGVMVDRDCFLAER